MHSRSDILTCMTCITFAAFGEILLSFVFVCLSVCFFIIRIFEKKTLAGRCSRNSQNGYITYLRRFDAILKVIRGFSDYFVVGSLRVDSAVVDLCEKRK